MPNLLTRAITYAAQGLVALGGRRTLGRPTNILYGTVEYWRGSGIDIEHQPPESLPSVYGCIALLADACTGLDWWITRPAQNGGRDLVTDVEAAGTLERWSKSDRWAWLFNGLASGNGLAHVERNDNGTPRQLTVYPAGRGFLNLYQDNSVRYSLSPMTGESFEAPPEDVAHLKYRPTGLDPRVGISPIISALPTVTMLLASRAGTTATHLNASRPSGYLATDGKLDREKAKELKDRWNEAHGGLGKRGGTAVLEQGLKYNQIDPSDLVKLAMIETQSLGVLEIGRLFGVPGSLLQAEGSGARASAVEDRRRLVSFTVSPLARLIEDALDRALLTERQRDMGLRCTCDTSAALVGEGNEMADVLSKLVNAGLITPNEGRAWLQYGSGGPEANLLRAPTNTWPIAAWAEAKPRSSDSVPAADQGSEAGLKALRLIRGGRS